jgi:hypothetical protein
MRPGSTLVSRREPDHREHSRHRRRSTDSGRRQIARPGRRGRRPDVHPAAREFGIASLLVKVLYAIKESGRDAPDEQYLAHVVDGNGGPIHALLEAGFTPAGHVDIHRGDIDAVIDHMLKDGESEVRLQAFVFDRQAVGKLVPSLWTFVRQDRGLITRSDGAGDIRVTVDFSHVIPPAHLDAQVERLKLNPAGRG